MIDLFKDNIFKSLTNNMGRIETILEDFVTVYESPSIQDALKRLEENKGTQDTDEWAENFYKNFNDNPDDTVLSSLNMDRKHCLNLVYSLVNTWQDNKDFLIQFEKSIPKVFKTERLERILRICLPMDRAQALFKLKLNFDTDTKPGIPWYSELQLPFLNQEFISHTEKFPSHKPPMNKRLFRLVNSDYIGLKENPDFMKWTKPTPVPL